MSGFFSSLASYGGGAVPLGANVPTFSSQAGQAVSGIPALNGVDTIPSFSLGSFGQATGGATPKFGFSTAPGAGGTPDISGFGFNLPTAQLGLSGIAALGNLWGAYNANKLARDQLDFTKSFANTNLDNSIKSYNTSLEDRARARGVVEGQTDQQVQSYIDKNRMTR